MDSVENEFLAKMQTELDEATFKKDKLSRVIFSHEESVRQKNNTNTKFNYYTTQIDSQEAKRDRLIREANAKYDDIVRKAESIRDRAIKEANEGCDTTIGMYNNEISKINTELRPPEPAHIIRTRSELAEVESIIHFRTKFFERLANTKSFAVTILPAKTWIASPEALEKEKELAELRRLARLGLLDEN